MKLPPSMSMSPREFDWTNGSKLIPPLTLTFGSQSGVMTSPLKVLLKLIVISISTFFAVAEP